MLEFVDIEVPHLQFYRLIFLCWISSYGKSETHLKYNNETSLNTFNHKYIINSFQESDSLKNITQHKNCLAKRVHIYFNTIYIKK